MSYSNNPFFVLDVTPRDDRRSIISKAEDYSLRKDPKEASEAQNALLSPHRRIKAEIRWFLDCDNIDIKDITTFINNEFTGEDNDGLTWWRYCPLTKFNIQYALLEKQPFHNVEKVEHYILELSRLFESVKASEVSNLINQCRRVANFPEIADLKIVESALDDYRVEIKQKLSKLFRSDTMELYPELATTIAESYANNPRYKSQIILEDVISDYQLFIADILNSRAEKIIRLASLILKGVQKIKTEEAVDDLLSFLREWDKLAQPLQLCNTARGSIHDESVRLLQELRDFSIALNNDYGKSKEALAVTETLQEVFVELPEFADLFSSDKKALSEIVESKKQTYEVISVMDSLDELIDRAKLSESIEEAREHLNTIVFVCKSANHIIISRIADKETATTMRINLGVRIRSLAVDLHNNKGFTVQALKLIAAVQYLFKDLPDIANELKNDRNSLSEIWQDKWLTTSLKEFQKQCDSIKEVHTDEIQEKAEKVVSAMKRYNDLINESFDMEKRDLARKNFALIARTCYVDLANTMQEPNINAALQILSATLEFSSYDSFTTFVDDASKISALARVVSSNNIANSSSLQDKSSGKNGGTEKRGLLRLFKNRNSNNG